LMDNAVKTTGEIGFYIVNRYYDAKHGLRKNICCNNKKQT
jgi:hypothetical protein